MASRLATANEAASRPSVRPWRVLHACEGLDAIRPLIEGELQLGMRPSVVTPAGLVFFAGREGTAAHEHHSKSLLNSWHEVRQWRKVLLDADPAYESDVVHSHSFSSGMAGVRNCPAVVYEVTDFIEDCGDPADNHAWLSRSFRVAEQFVITRAAAVVVRTNSMKLAVMRRGALAENTFVIPEPMQEPGARGDRRFLAERGLGGVESPNAVVVKGWTLEAEADGVLTAESAELIEAFAMIGGEVERAYFVVEAVESGVRVANELVRARGLSGRVLIVEVGDDRALSATDVVIAGEYSRAGNSPKANPTAEHAMARGQALLAADLPCNRDVTPEGRGCLWFHPGDYKDLAYRTAFLARNSDFRQALAAAARAYVEETRSITAVAEQYDAVYRHAFARRRSGGLQTPAVDLQLIRADA